MIRPTRSSLARFALTAALLPAFAACNATIGDPGESTPGSSTNPGPGGGPTGPTNCAAPPSASNFHRLNAKQYQESVSQVLGLPIALQGDLPPDASLYGFDNNADTSLTAALTQ